MPLHLTPAASSRVTKPRPSKKPVFGSSSRRKSGSQASRKPAARDDGRNYGQADLIRSLPNFTSLDSIPEMMNYAQKSTFADVPDRGAGMNSTRVAQVLSYRASLPPIVTVAHVHALGSSPTVVDREIADLIRRGIVRKISIPGAVSDCVVLSGYWINRVKAATDLTDSAKEKYISLLSSSTSQAVSSAEFTAAEAKALTMAGFLTALSLRSSSSSSMLRPGASVMSTLTSLATVSASGTMQAVGGLSILDHAAGGDRSGASSVTPSPADRSALLYSFALPSTGSYFKLLQTARSHLLALLAKLSPTYRVASMQSLRERWDGGVAGDDQVAENKKARGEFVGVLPGRTKKWKTFYGMTFEFILAECVGCGLMEGVKTGDGGVGVRAL